MSKCQSHILSFLKKSPETIRMCYALGLAQNKEDRTWDGRPEGILVGMLSFYALGFSQSAAYWINALHVQILKPEILD